MRYEAVIFDFDYTLADATEAIIECFNYAFKMVNLPEQDILTIKKTVGMSVPTAITVMTGVVNEEILKECRAHFVGKADEIMTAKTVLFPDTISTLNYLRDNNIKMGIVTNKYRYRIEQTLNLYNLTEHIELVIGNEDVINAKPDPEALNTASAKLNITKDKILYVGDSLVDAEAAERAGIDFVAVTTGTTAADEFAAFKYKDIITEISELKEIAVPQNIFDDDKFFSEYTELRAKPYSANDVEEKPSLYEMLPDLNGLNILDLGCGYGENCYKFYKMGAKSVLGIDIADKMLNVAKLNHSAKNIKYMNMAMEDISGLDMKFDLVISSLAIHYVKDFNKLVRDVNSLLKDGGIFMFSQEHPLTTAPQPFLGWERDADGNVLYYKLMNYNESGKRVDQWIIDNVVKYHRKFADIINGLVMNGFKIVEVCEPLVSDEVIAAVPWYIKNRHKPNFLIVKAVKNNEN